MKKVPLGAWVSFTVAAVVSAMCMTYQQNAVHLDRESLSVQMVLIFTLLPALSMQFRSLYRNIGRTNRTRTLSIYTILVSTLVLFSNLPNIAWGFAALNVSPILAMVLLCAWFPWGLLLAPLLFFFGICLAAYLLSPALLLIASVATACLLTENRKKADTRDVKTSVGTSHVFTGTIRN